MSDKCLCGCGATVNRGKRFIRGHHWKMRTPDDYFWPYVQKTDGCWLWTGTTSSTGYGTIMIQRKQVSAHRLSYEVHYGPIPDGMWVLHHCDNPGCVRPDHLFLGTPYDNTQDMISKNRWVARTPHPHCGEDHHMAKLTWEQVDELRRLYSTGDYRQIDLAKQYGVATTTICDIIHHRSWQHHTL